MKVLDLSPEARIKRSNVWDWWYKAIAYIEEARCAYTTRPRGWRRRYTELLYMATWALYWCNEVRRGWMSGRSWSTWRNQ